MVFCAYCGKSFTRKEHLERHIPSHTNVKPHRCSACQLSFARRDLLQRHHATYHEVRDPMEPLPGGVPTVAGRTPIACQNCANAKTGCDKRVPCSRCAEKNLPCAARFARRSSKAAIRAAQVNTATSLSAQLVSSSPQQAQILTPALMGTAATKQDSPAHSPMALDPMVVSGAAGLDMCFPQDMPGLHHPHLSHAFQHMHPFATPQKKPAMPATGQLSPEMFSAFTGIPGPVDGFNEFMGFGATPDFVTTEGGFQELIWADYPMDINMYGSPLQLAADFPTSSLVPPFSASTELSDNSSSSEPMALSSSQGSVHTRGTSIMSNGEAEGLRSHSCGSAHSNCSSSHGPFQPTQAAEPATTVPSLEGEMPEFEVVLASEAAWPFARCNPPMYSGSCPRTAIVHLECLEQKSKQEGMWRALELHLDIMPQAANTPQVVPLTARSRDRMLAITQSFLHKALDIHRGGLSPKNGTGTMSSPRSQFNFLVLPPSNILEYFLRNYVHSLSVYYPLVVSGVVDPNEMLDNSQASTLLVLLMIAQGAATVPMAEARYLSAGLTETCRISLFDIIEKNVELSADPTALRCALLFTLLGAWGGDKWHMDIAMGQRSMYLSMLKHAGMLEPQPSMIPSLNNSAGAELQWRSWLHRESQNRLVYNWVMVDQELSLFHDTAPMLSISDLQCPLPSPDTLWFAKTSDDWVAAVQGVYGCTANVNPQLLSSPSLTPSLCELFQDFLQDNLARRKNSLSPQQLRLLLHPLQSLLCHLRQMLSCMSDVLPASSRKASSASTSSTSSRSVTRASTMQRLEEVQAQLQHWYELTMACHKANPDCAVTRCNLVLYHLISLNAVSNFPEVERLARRESFDGSYWELGLRHKRCIFQREEAIFHCGQVLRLVHLMPVDRRPSWWSAAMYRAILTLWADSTCHLAPSLSKEDTVAGTDTVTAVSPRTVIAGTTPPTATGASSPVSRTSDLHSSASARHSASSLVAIDRVTPEDQALIAFMWGGEGVAVLTRNDSSKFTLEKPSEILVYGVQCIGEAVSTRVGDGLRRKIMALADNWNTDLS